MDDTKQKEKTILIHTLIDTNNSLRGVSLPCLAAILSWTIGSIHRQLSEQASIQQYKQTIMRKPKYSCRALNDGLHGLTLFCRNRHELLGHMFLKQQFSIKSPKIEPSNLNSSASQTITNKFKTRRRLAELKSTS
jgi:hypothetical protein